MLYTLINTSHPNAGSEIRFTRDTLDQYDVVLARGQHTTVGFITVSMRTAKRLGYITIDPDPDAIFTVRDDNSTHLVSSLYFPGTYVQGSNKPNEVSISPAGGGSENVVEYTIQIDEIGNGTSYIGYALPNSLDTDPVWKIKRVVETTVDAEMGNVHTTVKWSNGSATDMNVAWTNRLTTPYS